MKKVALLNAILVLVLVLSACAPAATPAPTIGSEPTKAPEATKAPEPTKAPASTATKAPEPTTVPAPTDVPKPTTPPYVAPTPMPTTFVLTITLKKGLKWDDGSPLTTKDLITTYDIWWLRDDVSWTYINKITAKDDQVIEFELNGYGWRPQYLLLRSNVVYPAAIYKEFGDKAAALRAKNVDPKGEEKKALQAEFNNFKPTNYLVSGPFKIDLKSVTEAQLTLTKNPNGYNADKINFDKIIVYYGETNQMIPLVLAGQIDYATHGFLPAALDSFKAQPNIKLITGLSGAGVGFWFNYNNPNFQKKEVRQAFAYIIDRDENGKVTYGDATKGVKLMAGMPDEIVDRWLTPEAKAKLNPYAKDWNKAAELLTKAGYKKGADGIWTDSTGKKWEVEVSAPADWADVLASAQNAVDQLKKFGIAASVRGYQSAERATVQKEGKYQILMDFGMLYTVPHPYRGYEFALTPPNNNPDDKSLPGMGFPVVQKGPDGKDYNLVDLIRQSNLGFDQSKQKEPLSILAQIVNEELPYFAFWVRKAMDPTNINNVQGWLPQTDMVYQNAQGGDNYAAIQFLAGTLSPTAANKNKIFQTGWPYNQPGKFHLNNFTTGSLQGMGGFLLPSQYPPLFWYMWGDNKYVPVMAEKFELVQK